MKSENLEAHIAKVHPRDFVDVPISEEERRALRRSRRIPLSRTTSRAFAIVVGIGAAVALLAVFAGPFLVAPSGGSIHVEPSSYDFGEIGQSTVSTTFRIQNRGTSNLVLQGVSTSCMCTSARVVHEGTTSPTFGYHSNPGGWSLLLPSAEEAQLEVFYDPTVHPELGHFLREVYIVSSDPAQREVSVTIHATEV